MTLIGMALDEIDDDVHKIQLEQFKRLGLSVSLYSVMGISSWEIRFVRDLIYLTKMKITIPISFGKAVSLCQRAIKLITDRVTAPPRGPSSVTSGRCHVRGVEYLSDKLMFNAPIVALLSGARAVKWGNIDCVSASNTYNSTIQA